MAETQVDLEMDVVEVEGLDQFFEAVTGTPTKTAPSTDADIVTVTSTPTGWTLKQAAENLAVSVNTIRKRIKDRELHGFKVDGLNGPEWRITPPAGTHANTGANTHSEPVTVTNTPALEALLKVIEGQTKQIEAMSQQLKAASDVMVYQRSQLESRDEEIKLLSDSQHKASWWARFKSWASKG